MPAMASSATAFVGTRRIEYWNAALGIFSNGNIIDSRSRAANGLERFGYRLLVQIEGTQQNSIGIIDLSGNFVALTWKHCPIQPVIYCYRLKF